MSSPTPTLRDLIPWAIDPTIISLQPVSALGLDGSLEKLLSYEHESLGDLLNCTEHDLIYCPGIGRKSVNKIIYALWKIGGEGERHLAGSGSLSDRHATTSVPYALEPHPKVYFEDVELDEAVKIATAPAPTPAPPPAPARQFLASERTDAATNAAALSEPPNNSNETIRDSIQWRCNPEDFALRSVSSLRLSKRVENALANDRIRTVGDILTKPEVYFLRLPGFGRKSLNSLVDALWAMGGLQNRFRLKLDFLPSEIPLAQLRDVLAVVGLEDLPREGLLAKGDFLLRLCDGGGILLQDLIDRRIEKVREALVSSSHQHLLEVKEKWRVSAERWKKEREIEDAEKASAAKARAAKRVELIRRAKNGETDAALALVFPEWPMFSLHPVEPEKEFYWIALDPEGFTEPPASIFAGAGGTAGRKSYAAALLAALYEKEKRNAEMGELAVFVRLLAACLGDWKSLEIVARMFRRGRFFEKDRVKADVLEKSIPAAVSTKLRKVAVKTSLAAIFIEEFSRWGIDEFVTLCNRCSHRGLLKVIPPGAPPGKPREVDLSTEKLRCSACNFLDIAVMPLWGLAMIKGSG